MEGFVDREAISRVLESVVDDLRSKGLTFNPDDAMLQVVPEGVLAVCPILIRESAKTKLEENSQTDDAFMSMMQSSKESRIENEVEQIRNELLGIGGCQHVNVHPTDNFCFDCQKPVT